MPPSSYIYFEFPSTETKAKGKQRAIEQDASGDVCMDSPSLSDDAMQIVWDLTPTGGSTSSTPSSVSTAQQLHVIAEQQNLLDIAAQTRVTDAFDDSIGDRSTLSAAGPSGLGDIDEGSGHGRRTPPKPSMDSFPPFTPPGSCPVTPPYLGPEIELHAHTSGDEGDDMDIENIPPLSRSARYRTPEEQQAPPPHHLRSWLRNGKYAPADIDGGSEDERADDPDAAFDDASGYQSDDHVPDDSSVSNPSARRRWV
ncbi:hypothetical protein B0H10DRAFT_2224416 [Mycena sp. CBHHK59/15]|nr:hypothetical protein B0H10DRAFT_2224416 [Mycena sp. CBHHK59/15]